jgi:hypothetical protein
MIPKVSQFGNVVSNVISNVGGYVGNIAREARDIPTAIGTGLAARMDRENAGPANLQKTVDNDTRAGWNTRAQVKDVFQAIGGNIADGTRSDQITSKGNYAPMGKPSLEKTYQAAVKPYRDYKDGIKKGINNAYGKIRTEKGIDAPSVSRPAIKAAKPSSSASSKTITSRIK